MVSETQDMSYLDKKQKEDLQRLKKFQSIDSEIFTDSVLEKDDRLRYFYMNEIELSRIKIEQKIVVREKDEALLRRLRPQIQAEGLIEPLTVEDLGNNQYLLLAGQHRYHVLSELGVESAPAKIYLELEPDERLVLGYMSNEARKDPPTGRKFGSLNEQFLEIKKKLQEQLNREPAEGEVINGMYMSKNLKNKEKLQKLKTKEILIAILLENVKGNLDSIINQYKFISDAQVPKTKITTIIENYKKNKGELEFPLLTSKNAFFGFSHLIRGIPITVEEQKQGNDYRHLELQNTTAFLELLVTKYIKPWMESGTDANISAAMNLCKRHIFETLCKLIASRLRDRDFDITSKDGKKAPLYTQKKVPWRQLFDDLEHFFNPDFLNHPNISQERSLSHLWERCEYYVITRPGRLPSF